MLWMCGKPPGMRYSDSQGSEYLTMNREARLQELLRTWHRLREEGRVATPRELCHDCPELEPALARMLTADDDDAAVPEVVLTDFDPDAEIKMLAAIVYPHSSLPEHQVTELVRAMPAHERVALMKAYIGDRSNRRHKPKRNQGSTGDWTSATT